MTPEQKLVRIARRYIDRESRPKPAITPEPEAGLCNPFWPMRGSSDEDDEGGESQLGSSVFYRRGP